MTILIPVRSGSKRIPGKAMKLLAGHPLLAYTLATAAALRPRCKITVVSNDEAATAYAKTWPGVDVFPRSEGNAQDLSPDIDWLREVDGDTQPDSQSLMVLRVTSPFRTAEYLKCMCFEWSKERRLGASSMRMITPTPAHPGKAWLATETGITPVLPFRHADGVPWHSSPTQSLPAVYQQTAGAEITTWGQIRRWSLAGDRVTGYVVTGPAALDINTQDDWDYSEYLVATKRATLPEVNR